MLLTSNSGERVVYEVDIDKGGGDVAQVVVNVELPINPAYCMTTCDYR